MNLNKESIKAQLTPKNIVFLIVGALLIWYTYLYMNAKDELQSNLDLLNASQKETVFYKDKYGRESALSEQMKVINADQFLKLKSSDSIITELQQLVKDNKNKLSEGGSSATVIKSEGQVIKTTPTVINTPGTIEDGFEYETNYEDKWAKYNIIANKDSIKLDFKYVDKYSLVLGKQKDSTLSFFPRLLSKKVDYAWVTTASPYSKIKSTKTMQVVVPPEPRLSLGIQAGYGFGGSNLQPAPYVGIGVSYRLLYLGL